MKVTVVDSGLGGIAFSRSVNLDIKYLNINLLIDKDGFPYGDKDLLWLKERLINLVEMAKTNIVIIACNTLSSLIFYYDLKFKKGKFYDFRKQTRPQDVFLYHRTYSALQIYPSPRP